MRVRNPGNFRRTARVQQVQDRQRGPAVFADSAKAVPERAAGHGRHPEPGFLDLAVQLIQAVNGMARELLRVQLRAAIRRGSNAVNQMCPVTLHLARPGIVQQRPNRGSPDVEAYNKGIRARARIR